MIPVPCRTGKPNRLRHRPPVAEDDGHSMRIQEAHR